MTSVHAIMILIIRIWAASTIVSSILSFSGFFLIKGEENDGYLYFYHLVTPAVWMILGIGAWVLAPHFTRKLQPGKSESSIDVHIDSSALVTIGTFLIGCFYLAQYLPLLMTDLGLVALEVSRQDSSAIPEIDRPTGFFIDKEQVIKEALITSFALWMFLKPIHFSKLVSHLRQVGLYKHDVEQ